jgi:N-acetylglucosaminyldiphosphoundecaprenol N-acetyl-beta-D-mannosaminyltransferase
MKRIEVFGCPMDVASMNRVVTVIEERIEKKLFTHHVVVNVAKLINMQGDAALAASVHGCDIVNIDGMGVVWGMRLLGHVVPERVAGIDLFGRLLEGAACRGFPVFLLGATQTVVESAAARCLKHYPGLRIAGYHHGYFWDDECAVVETIRGSGARLLFVAMTSPQKEVFISRWKTLLGVDFVMGVGGAFDIMAGKVARAPLWMQRSGLEWLFRLIQEPRRMGKRYLRTNVRFAWMLVRERLKNGRKSLHDGSRL